MPVRNEAGHIARAIESIRSQVCEEPYEVIVVDGKSDDGTREIVERWVGQDSRVRLIDNPTRTTPAALNVAGRAARGDIVVRVDGHWRIPPDYLRRVDEGFRKSGADSLGGRIMRLTRGRFSEGIEIARRTSLGGGLSGRNDPRMPEGFVSQANIATCWRREVMVRIGPFDECLLKNQDDEFNARLLRHGFSTYYDPTFHFDYYPPASLGGLFRQLYGYALYGPEASRKKGKFASARARLLPGLSLLSVLVLAALLVLRPAWVLLLASAYFLVVASATIVVVAREGSRYAVPVLLSYVTIHAAVVSGSIAGLLRDTMRRARSSQREGGGA